MAWKERNKHAVATEQRLAADGFGRVEFLDVEHEDPTGLRGFDVVFINGGNPFHLLHHLRESGADRILRELVEAGTPVVAASAGAMVLGPDLSLAAWFTPEMNALGLTDLRALRLVRVMVYPHFGRREADEEEIRAYERCSGNGVTRLADSQALWVKGGDPIVLSR